MLRGIVHLLTRPGSHITAFLIIGVVGLAVDMLAYACLALWLPASAARFASILIAISATWLLNRTFTFVSSTQKSILAEYVQYYLSSLCGAAVNYGAFLVLLWGLPTYSGSDYLAIFLSSAIAASVNFLLYKHLVFAKTDTVCEEKKS